MSVHLESSGLSHDVFTSEWLETNGLGGFASSTVCGASTRGYHGLLTVPQGLTGERYSLIARLDETLTITHTTHELGTAFYPGAVQPNGYRYIEAFNRELFPEWRFKIGNATLVKSILMPHGKNCTILRYELKSPEPTAWFTLQPFLSFKRYHDRCHQQESFIRDISFKDRTLQIHPCSSLPSAYISLQALGVSFENKSDWYLRFQLPQEALRGLQSEEDLLSVGTLKVLLTVNTPLFVVLCSEPRNLPDPPALFEEEKKRRVALKTGSAVADTLVQSLTEAADQFIVKRPDGSSTLLAGYHWFTDWGRDTMISLPGCCLITKRFEEARSILLSYSAYLKDGLIPNRFPDVGEIPEYNAVDSSLWYIIASYQYLRYTNDKGFAKEIYPTLCAIVFNYTSGTLFSIKEQPDALISCGDPHTNLTWMDARVREVPVTPRFGKPVEINALWYNALRILSEIATQLGYTEESRVYLERSQRTLSSFLRLFPTTDGYLYDRITAEGGDASIRPNQIFALSLPFPLVSGGLAHSIIGTVRSHLLTPYGLRSLSQHDPNYIPLYLGSDVERDAAYHQGTVWGWLIGPYLAAVSRFESESNTGEISSIIEALKSHLKVAGIGSISEIFDGDEPHTPRGCIAQAWSVAEFLRAYVEDVLVKEDTFF